MKCTLHPNIESISGKVGNLLFKTFKKPGGKTETRAYAMPRLRNGKYGYERKAKVTDGERKARNKFQEISKAVHALPKDEWMAYYMEWKAAKYMFNGKKYVSIRGYIMARMYAESNKQG